jgi:uncharacterized membrane protein YtjA (UPF0391 family)
MKKPCLAARCCNSTAGSWALATLSALYRIRDGEIQNEEDSSLVKLPLEYRSETPTRLFEGGIMLYWTLMFLVIALIAGVLGFTGVAIAATGVAKLLFVVFLLLFVISLATHLTRRGSGI